jgi:hypothetical protein
MAFCAYNHLEMNPGKTQMVGMDSDGRSMSNGSIQVSGNLVSPMDCAGSVKYLGVWISMSLQTDRQNRAISQVIGHHCFLARSHRLRPDQAVTFFNVYLAPKVEYQIRYAKPTAAMLRRWDATITKTMTALSYGSFWFKAEALTVCMGLILPSQLEAVTKVSEAFLRLNGSSEASKTGRRRMIQPGGNKVNRLARAEHLAKEALGWKFSVVNKRHQFQHESRVPTTGRGRHTSGGYRPSWCSTTGGPGELLSPNNR